MHQELQWPFLFSTTACSVVYTRAYILQWWRNINMIGGGAGAKGCKAANYPREVSVCKGQELGGLKSPPPPPPPVLPLLAYCTTLVQLQLEYCTAKLYSHRVSVSNSMNIWISLSQAAMAYAYCSLGT